MRLLRRQAAGQHADPYLPPVRRCAAALAATACLGLAQATTSAEIHLSGTGSFKPPSAEQLANLPADLPFSHADLASGKWAFSVLYDDRAADGDADRYAGRYAGAIRSFRVTIGNSSFDLPASQAELLVSDGGGSARHRESIRLEAKSQLAAGTLRIGWVQANQKSTADDLRGNAGALASDALPAPSTIAGFATASPFDRYLYLRVDPPGSPARPLLYLSSSNVSVAVVEPAAAR